ncbi:MAG: FAD:protein FMN transferase [Acidobacteriota bacterium]
MALSRCQRICQAMGTRFEVLLAGDDEEHLEAVAVAAVEEILRLEGLLSRFDPRSEIARVNRFAGIRPVRVDRELFALLEKCEQARQLTEGYFNVTRGAGLLLELDAEASTVRFNREYVTIDPGGIGKGYALDCVREILLRFGVTRALLNGGTSSLLALDPASDDTGGWPIDLRHPLKPEAEAVARVSLRQRALSCSAARHHEQSQSDIVNPLTGQPLDVNAACVVLAASATDAEIFSTALLAMGRRQATCYLERQPHSDLTAGWIEAAQFTWIVEQAPLSIN